MAIFHLSAKIISRGAGKSAVAAAAYRHACKMEFEREGRTCDYSAKKHVVYSELMIPDKTPAWFRKMIDRRDVHGASAALWNRVENDRKRANAQLARELEIALPLELSREQSIALIREYLKPFTEKGVVVDWAYHDVEGNPHVHAMMTICPMTEDGFGSTKIPVLDDDGNPLKRKGRIVYQQWAGDKEDLAAWRAEWARLCNKHLELAGFNDRIDHRSNDDRDLELEATIHLGAKVKGLKDKGKWTDRSEQFDEIRLRNADRIRANPEYLFTLITDHQSVFTERDIAKSLYRYIDDAEEFAQIFAKLKTSDQLIPMRPARFDKTGAAIDVVHFTTEDMLRIEADMITRAKRMDGHKFHHVKSPYVDAALKRYDFLSPEQQTAVRHVAGDRQIANVIGFAGAGKSTMLKAAREAFEASGYEVFGLALAGKAAEELQEASGIKSRTLASFDMAIGFESVKIEKNHVYVVDEAGMVGSKQLATLLQRIETAGAKAVLVGDPAQLQPISAGAAFRAIVERTGYAEISKIRRQKRAWQREASMKLANRDVAGAVDDYRAKGCEHVHQSKTEAILGLADAAAKDFAEGRDALCLAHTNEDVGLINQAVRLTLKKQGGLSGEAPYPTSRGERAFAKGDRIVFLQNDRYLGVKNGLSGNVTRASKNKLTICADSGKTVTITPKEYDSIDHGYAVTVHKSQGATVDRVHLLVTKFMTHNLAYVAMTRHKDRLGIHYSANEFTRFKGGVGQCLSRKDDKTITVDYDFAVGFGDRRGHDTVKALMDTIGRITRGSIDGLKGTVRRIYEDKRRTPSKDQARAPSGKKAADQKQAEKLARSKSKTSTPNRSDPSIPRRDDDKLDR